MTRTQLNQQMSNQGKTGLLITAETRMELLLARVEELEAKLGGLQATLDSHKQIATDTYNAIWGIFYPDNPAGWAYPGQIVIELRAQTKELHAENDALMEQNTSQRQYILELLAENRKLSELLDRALEALEP